MFVVSCSNRKGMFVTNDRPQFERQQVEEIIDLIESCPSWLEAADSVEATASIMRTLNKITDCEVTSIRQAEETFILRRKLDGNYSMLDWSKLFLLHRYAFNVPAHVNSGTIPVFGGWILPSDDNKGYPIMWPFDVVEGEIRLVGECQGYLGPP
jgi:hypothetical protein